MYKDSLTETYELAVYGAAAYVLYRMRAFRPARTLLIGFAPLVVILLITQVTSALPLALPKGYYVANNSTQSLAILWLMVFIVIARREKRTLVAEEATSAAAEAYRIEPEQTVSERSANKPPSWNTPSPTCAPPKPN